MSQGLVLVTGGAGFIGSHTADELLGAGYSVRVFDTLRAPTAADGPPGRGGMPPVTEWVSGDVRSRDDWRTALRGVEAVIHLAAYQDLLPDFAQFFHVNSVGTALLYELVVSERLPVRKIVVASSQFVYGEGRYGCAADGEVFPSGRAPWRPSWSRWSARC